MDDQTDGIMGWDEEKALLDRCIECTDELRGLATYLGEALEELRAFEPLWGGDDDPRPLLDKLDEVEKGITETADKLAGDQ